MQFLRKFRSQILNEKQMNTFIQSAQIPHATSLAMPTIHPVATTPQSIHHEFVRLGSMRLKLKNKMLAILPEIYKSGIWKKYAGTIGEYAGKFGEIAGTTVEKRLRLEVNLKNKPCLQAVIEKVGVHKVAMVAKTTTPETDQLMAEKLCNMSKMAVQSLSKELRANQSRDRQNRDCAERVSEMQLSLGGSNFSGPRFCFNDDNLTNHGLDFSDQNSANSSSPCQAIPLTKKIELDENSTFLFLKLKQKLGKNLSDKEFLKLILEEREKHEFPKKQSKRDKNVVLQKDQSEKSGQGYKHTGESTLGGADSKSLTGETSGQNSISDKTQSVKSVTGETSRYIPAARKRQALATTNGRCSYPNCNSPYAVIHHTNRYSESKSHDSIIPLCKVHHEFAHNNLIENEKSNAHQWKLEVAQKVEIKASQADVLYIKYRQESAGHPAAISSTQKIPK